MTAEEAPRFGASIAPIGDRAELGLSEPDLVARRDEGLLDTDLPNVEIDIQPSETERFPAPHAGLDCQCVEHVERGVSLFNMRRNAMTSRSPDYEEFSLFDPRTYRVVGHVPLIWGRATFRLRGDPLACGQRRADQGSSLAWSHDARDLSRSSELVGPKP